MSKGNQNKQKKIMKVKPSPQTKTSPFNFGLLMIAIMKCLLKLAYKNNL